MPGHVAALEPVPDTQVHHVILKQLKRYLLESGLQPTERIPPEHELAAQLHTSRSAVREALRSLEAIGMIDVQRGKGRYLKPFSFDTITENLAYSLVLDETNIGSLLEVRRALELSFLPQAAAALEAADVEALHVLVDAMRRNAKVGEPYITEDKLFHQRLFDRSGNDLLIKLLDIFWQLFHQVHDKNVLPPGDSNTVEAHAEILGAIEGGDIERATSLLDQHFQDVRRRLVNSRERISMV